MEDRGRALDPASLGVGLLMAALSAGAGLAGVDAIVGDALAQSPDRGAPVAPVGTAGDIPAEDCGCDD